MNDPSSLIAQINRAIDEIQPLTGQGEDYIWRPANKAWEALCAARDFITGVQSDDDDLPSTDGQMHSSGNGCVSVAVGDDARTPDVGSIADISARALGFTDAQDQIDYWNKMIGPIPSWERKA